MHSLNESLNTIWRKRGLSAIALWPLSLVFQVAMVCRRALYRSGVLKVHRFNVPVVVVGNISVGGTGKTPVVIAIAGYLLEGGWRPGIASRGYGGTAEKTPRTVNPESNPVLVGDEPVLMARRTGCPVVVAPGRPAAVQTLLDEHKCDVIVADDGLQHLALFRDIEIAVVDRSAGFGNGFCLPAGPLREPASRLESVDFLISNGYSGVGYRCVIEGNTAVKVAHCDVCLPLAEFRGVRVHAVAAIGNPSRFFEHLRQIGLDIVEHPFPDHHKFAPTDLRFANHDPILMTEKDAVKCEEFADDDMWYVPVEARLEPPFYTELSKRLNH